MKKYLVKKEAIDRPVFGRYNAKDILFYVVTGIVAGAIVYYFTKNKVTG